MKRWKGELQTRLIIRIHITLARGRFDLEWLSLITIQTWPSLGKQISWSKWNLPKTTHSLPETELHTAFSFALMSGDQSNFLTTIQLLKCIFISGIIRLLNEVNFHVYIDSRFNNVLSDFRYCKSASLGLSNFEKENRTFTKKKKKNEKSIIPMCWYVKRLILHCSKSLEDLCLSLHPMATWQDLQYSAAILREPDNVPSDIRRLDRKKHLREEPS